MQVLTVPNAITFARVLSVPVAVWLILNGHLTWAFWWFVAAGVSDALDGFIARSFRSRSKLGGYLDPAADKLLLVATYVALGMEGFLPLWLVVLVVTRDIIIVGGVTVLHLMRERLAMQPLVVGKLNTFAQLALAALVLAVAGPGVGLDFWIGPATWLVALTASWSLLAYVSRGVLILRTREKAS
ncbi:MAG TPA: CDP-alcohol phosphatidyltransferase family protein [Azospirillaceae bacterium]|nr:CDP-alcohol phosphatidyltransferase family protein [Azospirillaceae bacterium]